MHAVTVTSTVLNEVEDIDGLVSTLTQQTLRPEVIIVDGGSTDGTWERLQAARVQVSQPHRHPRRELQSEGFSRPDCSRAEMSASRLRRRKWWPAPMPAASTIPSGWRG